MRAQAWTHSNTGAWEPLALKLDRTSRNFVDAGAVAGEQPNQIGRIAIEGNQVLQGMNIDVNNDPHALRTAVLCLAGMVVAFRLIAFLRFYLRYRFGDSLKRCLCMRAED